MQKLFFIFLEQLVEVFLLIFLLFKHFYLQHTIETNELIFFLRQACFLSYRNNDSWDLSNPHLYSSPN